MVRYTSCLILYALWLLVRPLPAQPLFDFASIGYHPTPIFACQSEESAFAALERGEAPDTLALCLSQDQSATPAQIAPIRALINSTVAQLRKKGFEAKPADKQAGMVFDAVRSTFLQQYVNPVSMNRLFSHGEYDCVTSSILFALILERLGVPYEAMYNQHHVYLKARFKGKEIVLETTGPSTEVGVVSFTPAAQEEYINYLRFLNLIRPEDLGKPALSLFNTYYYQEKATGLWGILALQYQNNGIGYMVTDSDVQSRSCFEKAVLLGGGPQARHLLATAISRLLVVGAKDQAQTIMNGDYLHNYIILTQLKYNKLILSGLQDLYLFVWRTAYIEQKYVSVADTALTLLQTMLPDTSALRKGIELDRTYMLGVHHGMKKNWKEAFPNLLTACAARPQNLEYLANLDKVLGGLAAEPRLVSPTEVEASVLTAFADSAIRAGLLKDYFLATAYHEYQSGRMAQSIEAHLMSFVYSRDTSGIAGIIGNAMMLGNTQSTDLSLIADRVVAAHPVMAAHQAIQIIRMIALAERVEDLRYGKIDLPAAEALLLIADSAFATFQPDPWVSYLYRDAYHSVLAYLMDKQRYKRSLELIRRAMVLLPDDENLLREEDRIKTFVKYYPNQ